MPAQTPRSLQRKLKKILEDERKFACDAIQSKHTDRSGWMRGPWDKEPMDRIVWVVYGLPCLMKRSVMGSWNGYVGVPKDHPLFEFDYDDLSNDMDIRVHGGLTYAGYCVGEICTCKEGNGDNGSWWFGFDTAHAGDLVPGMAHMFSEFSYGRGIYRSQAYVSEEVRRLALQLTGEPGEV